MCGDVYSAMKVNSCLTRIESIGGSMASLGLLKMGDLLRANPGIQAAALEENGPLEKSGFEMFCNSFKRGQLSDLRIQSNTLTPPLVDVLAAASGLRFLRSLSLPNTSLDDKVCPVFFFILLLLAILDPSCFFYLLLLILLAYIRLLGS